ncbi:MAG: helix-turn-helix transcriptional regulator [Christensenellales bacterium]|jgi:AraC-like DNA-binding protein
MRKLFLRTTLTYVFILCLALLCAIPVMHFSLQSVHQMELTKQKVVLHSGIQTLEEALLIFHSTSQILRNDDILSAVAAFGTNIQAKDFLTARDAQYRFQDILLLVPLQKYSAIVLHQSGMIIDPVRIYASDETYYGFYYQHGDLSLRDWRELIQSDQSVIMPQVSLRIYGRQDEEYIIYKIPLTFSKNATATFFLCISKEDIARLFMSPEVMENGALTLTRKGNTYISLGTQDDWGKKDSITDEIPLLGMQASVSLTQNIYQSTYLAIQRAMLTSVGVLLMIGILLSLGFAYRYTKPIKNLLHQIKVNGKEKLRKIDVFRQIESTIRDMDISIANFARRINDMNAILRHNDFEQVLYGYPQIPSGRSNHWISPLAKHRHCLLLICLFDGPEHDQDKGAEYALVTVRAQLKQLLPANSFQHVLSSRHIIVLIPVSSQGEDPQVKSIAKQLANTFFPNSRILFSYSFKGAQAVPDAFWELRRRLAVSSDLERVLFCDKQEQTRAHFDFGQFQRIFYTLSTGSFDGLQSVMEQMGILSLAREMNRQEGRFLFDCLCASLRMVSMVQSVPYVEDITYDESISLLVQIEKWMQVAQQLCIQITLCKKHNAELARADVIEYVDQHFRDPQLCIASLAEVFSLKPKYVSSLFLEQTGRRYSEYVEDMRLAEACKKLEETNLPIQEIAHMVGYSTLNTFYKAFRRKFTCSPSTWREKNRK